MKITEHDQRLTLEQNRLAAYFMALVIFGMGGYIFSNVYQKLDDNNAWIILVVTVVVTLILTFFMITKRELHVFDNVMATYTLHDVHLGRRYSFPINYRDIHAITLTLDGINDATDNYVVAVEKKANENSSSSALIKMSTIHAITHQLNQLESEQLAQRVSQFTKIGFINHIQNK